MSTFLYFIPKAISTPIQSDEELIAAGLAHVGGVAGGPSNHTMSGPGGVAGAIWSMPLPDGTSGPAPVYRPDAQKWRQHPSKKHWVGVVKDDLPTPETLRRPGEKIVGDVVKLVDGDLWTIPICVPKDLRCMGGMTLPQVFDLADDGTLTGSVSREFESIAERCYAYFLRFIGEQKRPTADEAAQAMFRAEVDLAAELIGINYRVGRFEAIAMLRLLGHLQYHRVLRAAVEADRIDAWWADEQKKAAASVVAATDGGLNDAPAADSSSATSR